MRVAALLVSLIALPALAQEPPRFEGLEMQLQRLEQRQYDRLENDRVTQDMQGIIGGQSSAQRQLRSMEIDRQRDLLLLQSMQERDRIDRERTISETTLPMRRIAPSSVLRVSQPELYGLPKLPANKYYARLEGRFVVVDATSELVEKVLPVQPTDPTADVPAGSRPMPLPPIPQAN